MELKQPAAAGTLESGDILIELEPNEGKGLNIRLDSTVANQFGKRIKEVISETFAEMGVKTDLWTRRTRERWIAQSGRESRRR